MPHSSTKKDRTKDMKKRKEPLPADAGTSSSSSSSRVVTAARVADEDVLGLAADLADNPRYHARLVSALQRLNALVSKSLAAALPPATVRLGAGDAAFSDFLSRLDGRGGAPASSAAAAAAAGGGHAVSLEIEGATVWGRLSFLNEATLHRLRVAVGEECIDAAERGPLRLDDEKEAAAHDDDDGAGDAKFKDEFVDMFTAAFSSDLETLQSDKFLQELGASSSSVCVCVCACVRA
jgi:hypothetical protein